MAKFEVYRTTNSQKSANTLAQQAKAKGYKTQVKANKLQRGMWDVLIKVGF